MRFRSVSIAVVMLIFVSTIFFTLYYGPSRRTYVIPDKTVAVTSAQELDSLWRSSGVHGRVAVIFTRHLKPQPAGDTFPEIDYLDKAMSHGTVRTVYYVVPDDIWTPVVSENILNQELIVPPKRTDTGFILLHRGGRIHVMPLSKYIPEQEKEKVLVVIEPQTWTPQEQFRIDSYFRSGLLAADLKVSVSDRVK